METRVTYWYTYFFTSKAEGRLLPESGRSNTQERHFRLTFPSIFKCIVRDSTKVVVFLA